MPEKNSTAGGRVQPADGTRLAQPYAVSMPRTAVAALLIIFTTTLSACGDGAENREAREALAVILSNDSPDDDAGIWEAVQAFYARPDARLVWRDSHRVDGALAVIADSSSQGLSPEDYGGTTIAESWGAVQSSDAEGAARGRQLATFDVQVTTALLQLGRDVAVGRVQPEVFAPGDWQAAPEGPDLAIELAETIERDDLDRWLDRLAPAHEEYARLRQLLASLPGESADADAERERVRLNLDRWRWMPDELGARHIIVNVPEYVLRVREQGETVLDMRVVVGKSGEHQTPVFSDVLETVVFNPYWNIPDSIVAAETAPAVREDSDYLARNRMEVLRVSSSGPETVDPDEVDWEDEEALEELLVRQRPGADNALGQVKFLFPNDHAVYLHDTPADALFSREARAFSHGCVRVDRPEALAQYILRETAGWDAGRVAEALAGDDETHVPVDDHIPVHLVYFTVAVGEDGTPTYFEDIYGFDRKQQRATRER